MLRLTRSICIELASGKVLHRAQRTAHGHGESKEGSLGSHSSLIRLRCERGALAFVLKQNVQRSTSNAQRRSQTIASSTPNPESSIKHRAFYLGASEATIFSKQGSPRSGSHNASSFNWP